MYLTVYQQIIQFANIAPPPNVLNAKQFVELNHIHLIMNIKKYGCYQKPDKH